MQWLEDLVSGLARTEEQQQPASPPKQQQRQQQQYAAAALRRLLLNDPCVAAAAAGVPPEHTVGLLRAGADMWAACHASASDDQVPLTQLRRLWALLRVLARLPLDDVRVTRFLVNCKVRAPAQQCASCMYRMLCVAQAA